MEESPSSTVLDGRVIAIRFGLATRHEVSTSSNSDCPISHASQLSNPFLGLPLESGKCESCGTAEPGKCEGHFGYIELPIPIYHPSHITELKRMLNLLCLKCLKLKTRKIKNIGIVERELSSCCEDASQVSVNEVNPTDGACFLELKLPSKSRLPEGFWNFLEKYGFRYGDNHCRPLLPIEVMVMLKRIPEVTRKKLVGKGYFPQEGYILQHLPVPPNCLSMPDVSDGFTIMSSDLSTSMLKKVLRQVEIIKSSRSGTPNFESHEVEANDLQTAVAQYLQVRGTAKASRDIDTRFGVNKEANDSSKAWLEKMKTLFIRKGSGFSSRSVITGDPYKRVDEIGLPFEIAQRITFEERVNEHNMNYLQKLVDENLCLTYRDGLSTYSLREGSKGHTYLRPGQVVHRRIMDGDIVFINRPPTTHKHSLQALSVYVHEDHTVKINPLICGPLSADFDGDCVHLFYPQSLAAKAEVLELFSVEKQLLSSHSGNLNLQMATDSLLSLKMMFKNCMLNRVAAQQLAMYVSNSLPKPALVKSYSTGPLWTALQILQTALPASFDCHGERHLICKSEMLKVDFNRDLMQSIINDIVASIFFEKGPDEVLRFFSSLQPLLMENIFSEGFSVGLEDFYVPRTIVENVQKDVQDISPLLFHLRSTYNELVDMQVENHLRLLKIPVANFILRSSAIGNLIDSRSDSAINKVVQQIGFLGIQVSDKGKLYSKTLVTDISSLFRNKYPFGADYPAEEFGLVRTCLFHGLDPYQEMVHSIASREVIVRSSRGLTEPGTLFKNLMAILRDVVICYDGTVRNICSNSIIQFEYGVKAGVRPESLFPAGEPVGVLAATAMSNPAYKAVLESTPSSNSSWAMMKEILLCAVNFKNDPSDRRVVLYLNDCDCGRKYCGENAVYRLKNHLKKVSLNDIGVEFLIEYKKQHSEYESSDIDAGLVGHVHLNKIQLNGLNISMADVLDKCQEKINLFRKKKKIGHLFKRIVLSVSECCSFQQSCESKSSDMPCLKFFWQDMNDHHLEKTSHILADTICPVLLETIIKGDPRVCTANIIWITPDTTTWIRNPNKSRRGELALDVVLEKDAVKQSGDAWRILLDSCLPLIHLIDTRRSIPYAIKQVQELLGISCAFEQAVQRLSRSVTMVAKGVLKDHLILLANSMSCAGNLVGFNMGGIKALSRTLNVQVPFTEATLFTPKKCFERAAEKCHVDALSSIVASCSWGKHVAVGTGSKFDILLDTREVGLNQEEGTDVYGFLHLVRGISNGEELKSACLGAEVDDLDWEGEDVEMGMSPEHNTGSDKPTFEDTADFENDLKNQKWDANEPIQSKWDKSESQNVESSSGSDWVVEKKSNPKPSGWGTSVQTEEILSTKQQESGTGGWGATNSGKVQDQAGSWAALGKKIEEVNETGWNQKDETGWNRKSDDSEPSKLSWGKPKSQNVESSAGGWVVEKKSNSKSSWGTGVQKEDVLSTKAQESGTGGWGTTESGKAQNQQSSWSALGKNIEEANETGWNQKGETGWNRKSEGSEPSKSNWGKPQSQNVESSGGDWVVEKKPNSKSSWGTGVQKEDVLSTKAQGSGTGGWGTTESGKAQNKPGSWAASGKKVEEANETGWSQMDESGWNRKLDGNESSKSNWAKPQSQNVESGGGGDWVVEKKPNSKSSWGTGVQKEDVLPVKAQGSGTGGWGIKESGKAQHQPGSWSHSGKNVEKAYETGWNQKDERNRKSDDSEPSKSNWGKPQSQNVESSAGGWVVEKKSNSMSSWGTGGQKEDVLSTKAQGSGTGGWGATESGKAQNKPGSWAASGKKVEQANKTGWNQKDDQPRVDPPSGLASSTAGVWPAGAPEDSSQSGGWNAVDSGTRPDKSGSWASWGNKIEKSSDEAGPKCKNDQAVDEQPGGSWLTQTPLGAQEAEGQGNESQTIGWGSSKNDSWGKVGSQSENGQPENDSKWNLSQNSTDQPASMSGWDSPNVSGRIGSDAHTEWGHQKRSFGKRDPTDNSRGWGGSSGGEWRNKRNNHPANKSLGGLNHDSSASPAPAPAFTATRQRLDMFTSEEQDVLLDVETIMQSIRRIMQQSRDKDGEALAADDQKYILDNVFNYHPDKEVKMGTGIDYVMVNKHSSFQESRCFYIVSTDGRNEDFSYRKCLENYIKGKYPDKAEAFNEKYFRKPRPTINRERSVSLAPQEAAGTENRQ